MSKQGSFDDSLQSDSFFQNPYPIYQTLREEAPVYWCEAWGAWVVTRYEDVTAVLRQSDAFSSAGRVKYLLRQLPPQAHEHIIALERHYDIGLAHTDPPDHTRLRSLLTKAFTPRVIEDYRPRIERVANELIDEALAKGSLDIIHDIAYPLPATIIAELIGAPSEDIGLFREWAVAINQLFEKGGRVTEASAKLAQDSLFTMRDYIIGMVEERQRTLKNDILGRLVSAKSDEEKLTINELVSTVVTLFVAGHETTTNLIGNGMLSLLQHPEQWRALQDSPKSIGVAIEEILRYEPSVPRAWRIAKQDVQIGDQTIPQGELVFAMLSSANRDPNIFTNPDTFDINRTQNRHVAFGYGIHFCIGAPLARTEGAIAINAMLRRLPNLQLTGEELKWRHDIAIRSLEALPVRLPE